MYEMLMTTPLPAYQNRMAMSCADATRAWISNLFYEKSPEMCMWEATVIKAERYDHKQTKMLPNFSQAQHKLWLQCWSQIELMDVHHFPLWEKGVHDVLQSHFPVLMRIFSQYTKGVSGVDSATDALEMELEEFHDFVKDAKVETRMVSFTTMTNVFAKANASNTSEAYEQRMRGRRNVQVQRELEEMARQARRSANDGKKDDVKMPDLPKHLTCDRFRNDYPEAGSMKVKKPDNRLTLIEFLSCLVRISFLRANPKHGQYDNKAKLVALPGCLKSMLIDCVIPNAKQDMSSLFREEIAGDADVQAVIDEYREKLLHYFTEVNICVNIVGGKAEQKMTLETWMDIAKGFLTMIKQRGGRKGGTGTRSGANASHLAIAKSNVKPGGEAAGLGEGAIVGDCTVQRESDISGDERCKEKFTCRLTILEAKFAFLNSQSLEQMAAGDAVEDSDMATLDFDEFLECCARAAKDKYCEIKLMTLSDGVRGIFQNILREKSDEGVLRDATYIHAERYSSKLSKPLPGQSLAAHRKWIDCWQNVEVADLHHFPLWEKGVFDCLQEAFQDVTNIFAHYAKGVTGGTTAEDAVEMTMTEFKELVKDVGLETKDLKFDVMANMFKKANAANSNAAHFAHKASRGTADARNEFAGSAVKPMGETKKSKSASKAKDTEIDMELVLYEFVEVLIRIAFWRANPFHGIMSNKSAKLVPLPDCLHQMLHEVVLPNAKRDDSALFKERLAGDKAMQSSLASYEKKLKEWFDVHTQSMFLRGEGRKLQYQQWQDLLKKGWGTDIRSVGYTPGGGVGNWEIYQDSEITGDERCKNKFKISLSLPQAKFAFISSQSLDQLSVGQAKDTDAMTTLEFDEFKECIARCALDKYKPIRQMSAAVMITSFCKNLLGEVNTEECMNTATLIKAERYNWKRHSQTLPGQSLKEQKRWLEVWQRLELTDMYYFPLWEQGVHDLLQKHFSELSLIFLAYCRSLLGSASAEDAMEMEMSEFKDFVDECGLETKATNFDLMTNNFIKVNATNNAAAREQHHESRGSSATKADERGQSAVGRVAGRNDGTEAKKDQELVLYEFIGLLVRIAFQRSNPTFGNFGNKKAIVHLPGCLESMLVDEILPRARKDSSAAFRDTVMADKSVNAVIKSYEPRIKQWYTATTNDDSKQTTITDKLQMDQWLRLCDEKGLLGTWECYRESDITGDPSCKTQYKWRLSNVQVRFAFMDCQSTDQLGAAQSTGDDEMATVDYDEFVETLARLGIDKYRAVKEVAPADAVKGFIQNLLNDATSEEVVARATRVKCARYDYERDTKQLKGESEHEYQKWMKTWGKLEIMDVHLWPMWEKEVHDILHPLFKELQCIFLAYTRSLQDVNAEDAMEMSLDEFHDFVVDVGLETKKYKFDVMCNQFIKANATNTAQARAQRQEEKRDAGAQLHDKPDHVKYNADGSLKHAPKMTTSAGTEAKKDQELNLQEFLNMLVRIAFWRSNPHFGLHDNKDELVPVALALSTMLNEIILPHAKRENSAEFRNKEMQDPKLLACLDTYKDKLKEWYDKKCADDSDNRGVISGDVLTSDELGMEEWVRVCDRNDIVGEWQVEQLSEITGDVSTKGNIKARLSIPTVKSIFVDSQEKLRDLGSGEADVQSKQSSLDFNEFLECVARMGCAKYSAIKSIDAATRVKYFLQNFFSEMSEEDCMRQGTYIRAVRYDINDSSALKDESAEDHAAFLAEFKQLDMFGLYGFPLWEQEVHDQLHANFAELSSIFRSYCKSLGEGAGEESAKTMDVEEFHDFVIDVGLETNNGQPYTFAMMKEQFTKADKSGKGMAGPAANQELELYEFLNVILRVSFWRLNPEFGELTMEHQDTILPVPQCFEKTLNDCILPRAHRDDAAEFRSNVMPMPEVQAALSEGRPRLQAWYATVPLDDNQKLGITQWISILHSLNVLGTFTCTQGSDIVGDDRVGTEFKCRLSVPQAKAAFVNAQKETGGQVEDTTLDFDELLECIARCGEDKYRTIKQMKPGDTAAAMIANILGDLNEEQVITASTYITAERFVPSNAPPKSVSPEQHKEWLMTWEMLQLSTVHGFPLWEKDVHDLLVTNLESLQSIFRAYAAATPGDAAANQEMDMEEFHDFVIDSNLITDMYGFDTISGSFTKANAGSNDKVLEFHEFLTMLVRIAFYRANPRYGLQHGKRDAQSTALSEAALERQEGTSDDLSSVDEVPLPGCLSTMLTELVLPNARQDGDAKEFAETTLPLNEVQQAISSQLEQISTFYEMTCKGRPSLELDQWLGALEQRLLFSTLEIEDYVVRLTEPQAKAAFYASAASPSAGLLPDELPVCIARTACDKYKHVTIMAPGAKVRGFLTNLLTDYDEEDVVLEATGGAPVAGKHAKKASPQYSADGMLLGDAEDRITGVASGTQGMLMPGERTMADRDKFETQGYDPSRDSIDKSAGATLAGEASGLHES